MRRTALPYAPRSTGWNKENALPTTSSLVSERLINTQLSHLCVIRATPFLIKPHDIAIFVTISTPCLPNPLLTLPLAPPFLPLYLCQLFPPLTYKILLAPSLQTNLRPPSGHCHLANPPVQMVSPMSGIAPFLTTFSIPCFFSSRTFFPDSLLHRLHGIVPS
jgi:hypothetical protein